MTYIVAYQKASNEYTTYDLNTPEGSTELCTLDGITYVCIPSGAALNDEQHPKIANTIKTVGLDDELCEQIKAASPHVALIQKRVREKIEELYSVHDEIKLIRTAPSPEFSAYNEHAELCRQWGREQKALLGLSIT